MLRFIDQKIRQAFSKAAMQYDVLSGLHKEIARELLEKVSDIKEPATILDIGMGTGYLTAKLIDEFPDSLVVGLDPAPGMVTVAFEKSNGYKIVQSAAGELPFKWSVFDLVLSNLAFQWVEDLPKSFGDCHFVLKDSGVICLTMFGFNTFQELFASLEAVREPFPIRRLAHVDEIKKAMALNHFRNVEIETESFKAHFPDMFSLLDWIRGIGANALPKEVYVGKDLLNRAAEYYDKNFRDGFGVQATYEVIWVKAQK